MYELVEIINQTQASKILITFFIAMMPILELRGAIPLGISMGLDHWTSMIISIVGNCVPVPFIILFIRQIFKWLRSHNYKISGMLDRIEIRARGKWQQVHTFQLVGLMVIVAIPLPGTGAWTGALIAALMNMRLKNAIPAIFAGVVIAGFLITGISYGFTSIFS